MSSARVADISATLDAAPGPSPWYLRAPGAGLASARGRLVWRDAGRNDAQAGKMALVAPDGAVLLVVDFYVRVQTLGGARFLLWRQRKAAAGVTPDFAPVVDLEIHDADRLAPFDSVESACAALAEGTRGWVARAAPIARVELPADASAGTHALAPPPELESRDEILVLADASAPGSSRPDVRVLVLRPGAHSFEVLPQDWFNEGEFDFGYQWITRIARDPGTGALVGDGIRIAPFRLDVTGRRLGMPVEPATSPGGRIRAVADRTRTLLVGVMLTGTGILAFATVADDARHVSEWLGASGLLLAGLALLVVGAAPGIERRFPLRELGYGLALGATLGLATNGVPILLPLGALVGLGWGFSRRAR